MTWPIVISDVAESCKANSFCALPENFELHLKMFEHILKYVSHHMLGTVLNSALRIFESPVPDISINILAFTYKYLYMYSIYNRV